MDGCEGHELTARPEGHWVLAGKEWVNMARCAAVDLRGDEEEGEEGETVVLFGALGDGGTANWVIAMENAAGVLAYLKAHAYQA